MREHNPKQFNKNTFCWPVLEPKGLGIKERTNFLQSGLFQRIPCFLICKIILLLSAHMTSECCRSQQHCLMQQLGSETNGIHSW